MFNGFIGGGGGGGVAAVVVEVVLSPIFSLVFVCFDIVAVLSLLSMAVYLRFKPLLSLFLSFLLIAFISVDIGPFAIVMSSSSFFTFDVSASAFNLLFRLSGLWLLHKFASAS